MTIFLNMNKLMSKIHDNSYHDVKNDSDIVLEFMFFAVAFNYLRQDSTKLTNQADSKECFDH